MENVNIIDILDAFVDSDVSAVEIDTSRWKNPLSSYQCIKQTINNKRYKKCCVIKRDEKVILMKTRLAVVSCTSTR